MTRNQQVSGLRRNRGRLSHTKRNCMSYGVSLAHKEKPSRSTASSWELPLMRAPLQRSVPLPARSHKGTAREGGCSSRAAPGQVMRPHHAALLWGKTPPARGNLQGWPRGHQWGLGWRRMLPPSALLRCFLVHSLPAACANVGPTARPTSCPTPA